MKFSFHWRRGAQQARAFALIFALLLQTVLIPQAVQAAPALAPNAPLSIADVASPDVNCLFDADCTITAEDLTDHFTPPAAAGDAFLQSRTWPIGEAGTPGEKLYAYLYRIDLSKATGVTAQSCVTSLKLDFGPITQLDYNNDQQLDDLFVVVKGGLGNVRLASADLTGDALTILFDPVVCVGSQRGGGDSTFFIGLASTEAPQTVPAQIQGTNALEQTLKARAPKRPQVPLNGNIAYVLKGDTATAADFKALLESYGFGVTLVPLNAVLSTDFSQFDLTLIADDTGYLSSWGDAAGQVTQIANHSSVLGLGEGGYSFFGQLTMKIGWPNGWHNTTSSVIGYPTLEYYQTPTDLTAALGAALPLYSEAVKEVGIHLPEPATGVTVLGTEPTSKTHHPLIAEDCHQLWGFSGGPKQMTKEGQLLFINAVVMALRQCQTAEQQCNELESPRQIPSPTLVNFDDLGDAVTIADHYVPAHGLHFYSGDDTKVITYADREADPTKARSTPNVATNNAVSGTTSVNVPLRFWFDQPKTHVGFYMGNGETQEVMGTLIAYDATGQIICVVRDPVPEPYQEFLGVYDPAGRIAIVELTYGETLLSESIDDLYFAPANREEEYPLPEEPPFEVSIPLTINVSSSTNTNFVAEFELPKAQLLKIRGSDDITYTQFILPGVELYGNTPGLPDVPITRRMLAAPRGATVKLVGMRVVNGKSYLVDLWPAQPPAVDLPMQQEEGELPPETFQDPPFTKDAEAYGKDALFPAEIVSIEQMGQMRDVDLVQLNIAGGQYNPATKVLQLFESVEFEVVFEGGEGGFLPEEILKNPFERSFDGIYAQMLNHRAIFEFPIGGIIAPPSCIGYEYVIITHPDFRPAADALRNWKNSRGLSTVVRETGNDPGDAGTTATQIRNSIRSYYNNCLVRPSYVLLLGDAEFIPPFYRMTMYNDNAGTDLDYSLMNDNDIMPDLAYGRIPVDTLADAQIVINKIINYENLPPFQRSFYSNVTIASYFQCCRPDVAQDGTASRSFVETSELIRNGLMNRGYTVERVYNTNTSYHNNPNESSFYNSATRSTVPNRYYNGALLPADLRASSGYAWNGNSTNVVDAFNAGRFLMLHRGHGGPGGWGSPGFGTGSLGSLSNGNRTPVVYSINCASGLFDNETLNPAQQNWNYGTSVNGSYWAERLLRMEGGAVGIIGDTRNSPTWANSALARGLFDATFPNTVPNYGGANTSYRRLGDILNYGKAYMVSQVGVAQTAGSVSSNAANTNVILYHVFGDPSMKMWTSYPYIVVFPWYAYDILTISPRQTHVQYPINGATITALQDGNPIGRADVVDGMAVIDFISDADPNLPIELSAINPDGTGAELGTADATGSVEPQSGGGVEHPPSKFKLTFGPGAVDVETNLFYNTMITPSHSLGNGIIALRSFSLDAFDEAESDGNPAQVTQFNQPFTMILGYTDEELAAAGVDEASLRCQYLDESDGQWKPINSQVDAENNLLTCSTDHFTEFALVAEAATATSQTQLFLPLVTSQ